MHKSQRLQKIEPFLISETMKNGARNRKLQTASRFPIFSYQNNKITSIFFFALGDNEGIRFPIKKKPRF